MPNLDPATTAAVDQDLAQIDAWLNHRIAVIRKARASGELDRSAAAVAISHVLEPMHPMQVMSAAVGAILRLTDEAGPGDA